MILLTSESCSPCKVIKAFIENNNLKDRVNFVDIKSPDGRVLLDIHNLRSVPVLITVTGNLVGQAPIMKVLNEIIKE